MSFCSSTSQGFLLSITNDCITAFEEVEPALVAAGDLTAAESAAIIQYVSAAGTALDAVIAGLGNGTTISKITAIVNGLVGAFDSIAPLLPDGTWLALAVNTAASLITALLNSLMSQGAATTPAPVAGVPAEAESEFMTKDLRHFDTKKLQARIAKMIAAITDTAHKHVKAVPA